MKAFAGFGCISHLWGEDLEKKKNIAIILSGGTGARLGGDIPKQYIEVRGKTIISYVLEVVMANKHIEAVQIVADEKYRRIIEKDTKKYQKFVAFSAPGVTRQMSVYNALKDISYYADEDAKVLIHDAARPCVTDATINACFDALKTFDGAMPVLPMKDTVYESKNGQIITGLLARENIFAGQAPESYAFEAYYEANKRLLPDKILEINGSSEPAVMAGMKIALIDGDENNFKITTMSDLEKFKALQEKAYSEKVKKIRNYK